jgi:hypothetical protein
MRRIVPAGGSMLLLPFAGMGSGILLETPAGMAPTAAEIINTMDIPSN